MEIKKDIRSRMLKLRNAMDLETRDQLGLLIQKNVMESKLFQEAEWILLYVSAQSEVATDDLLRRSLEMKKKIACPKVLSDHDMEFFQIEDAAQLESGYRGILEPRAGKLCAPLDALVLVPGCAFDRDGFRLGYGKGFYDRYLKRHARYQTMGLAYSSQVLEKLPHEPHDMPLQYIMTENERITIA